MHFSGLASFRPLEQKRLIKERRTEVATNAISLLTRVPVLADKLIYRRKECHFGFLGYSAFFRFGMLVGLPQSYDFHFSDERQDDGRWSEFT